MLNLFSSVWFGITLLTLIFVYSSAGSAIPALRQHRWFEMTEMEWFNAWPYQLLIALMCINIAVVTLRRIQWNLAKAGVWVTHAGILLLCLGSVYYFGTKLEGDTPVFRRRAVVQIPGLPQPVSLLIRPGNEITVTGPDGEYRFAVESVQTDWPILSGEDKGKTAYAVMLGVQTPTRSFTRQLLEGYLQYTEDILPDGRAMKVIGQRLVDESLAIRLAYEPQHDFYLMHTAALYVRPLADAAWIERPLPNLQRYNARIADPSHVWMLAVDEPPPVDPTDIPVPATVPGDPLRGCSVRVTGYLPYALDRARWVDDGEDINPVIHLRLDFPDGQSDTIELVARDEARNRAAGGDIALRWVDSPEELETFTAAEPGYLRVQAEGQSQSVRVTIRPGDYAFGDGDAEFRTLEGSSFEFRIRKAVNRLPMEDGSRISFLITEIRTPETTFTRTVADDPTRTRDASGPSGAGHDFGEPDPRIRMEYVPSPAAMYTLVAGPDPIGLTLLQIGADGSTQRTPLRVGETVTLPGGHQVTPVSYLEKARLEVRPEIVPVQQRERDAGDTFSKIRVTVSNGNWQRSLWLPFNAYALPSAQYAVPQRITHQTRTLRLPDGQIVEMMFSRRRQRLAVPVVLEDFELLTHTGGYERSLTTVRDFVSHVRFATAPDSSAWGNVQTLALNAPVTVEGLSFFQSG